ncbi:MAG: LamG-like jellyroll fold domain-containing protein [Phycisphaerales bacterium]
MRKQSILLSIMALTLGSIAGSARAELVGHWRLDEGAGVTANDASGHGNHGTLKGNPKWTAGILGQALDLDGVDDFVEIPHSDSLTVDKNVTVTAWIKTTQYTGTTGAEYQGIVAKSNSPRSYSLYLYSSGSLHFSTNGIGTMSTTKVPLNEWAHVAAQVVDGVQKYYINGVAAGVDGTGVVLPGLNDVANVVIGKTWEASREFFGKIDDVRIYNDALDLAGVKESMKDIPFAAAMVVAPADGSVIGQIQYTLKWEAGDFATSHAVYFAESLEAVENRQATPVTTTTASLDVRQIPGFAAGLTPGKTYYWSVDEVAEGNPASPWKGPVWSFTVQPLKAWNPAPVDGGQFVPTNSILTWNNGMGVVFHTIYLGTSREAVANGTAAKRMVVQPTFTPDAPLANGTTYYWRVDEFSGGVTRTGDVWSFTTLPAITATDPHLLGWWKLDEGIGTTAIDSSGNGNHGTIVGNPAWVDGLYGSALEFSTGKYVNCGVAAASSIKGDFTLASWVKLNPGNAGIYVGVGG